MTDKEMPLATTSGTPEKPAPTTAPVSAVDSTSEFAELLKAIGYRANDLISVCYKLPGQASMHATITTAAKAPGFAAAKSAAGHDVWFGTNPIRAGITKGRGGAVDVTAARCFYIDADLQTPGIKTTGCPNEEVAFAIAADVAEIVGQKHTDAVHSGHGIHFHWALVDGDIGADFTNAEARQLSKDFGRLVQQVAATHGVTLDNVSDLARVARVPGTINHKGDPVPARRLPLKQPGGPLSRAGLRDRLDEHLPAIPAPEAATAATTAGTVPVAGDPRVAAIMKSRLAQLAACPDGGYMPGDHVGDKPGRNNALNLVAGDLARFPISEDVLRDGLMQTMVTNGYVADESEAAVIATIDKAFAWADTQPPKTLSDPVSPAWQVPADWGPKPTTQKTSSDVPKVWRADELSASRQARWLATGRIPQGDITLLVGEEGIGKSLLWVYIVAAITTGQACPDFGIPARAPAHVLIVITEDDWASTVRPRLEAAGADLSLVSVLCSNPDGSGSPTFPADLEQVRSMSPVPSLIVVDAWLDTVPGNLTVRDPQGARRALHPWKEVANATDAAVLLLTHTNRQSSPNPRDKYGISGELRKKARMALYAQKGETDGVLVVGPEKANGTALIAATVYAITPVQHFEPSDDDNGTVAKLVFTQASDKTASQLIADEFEEANGEDPLDKLAAQKWLQEYLAINAPSVASAEVKKDAVKAGISARTLQRARKELGVVYIYEGVPAVTRWALSANQIQPDAGDSEKTS